MDHIELTRRLFEGEEKARSRLSLKRWREELKKECDSMIAFVVKEKGYYHFSKILIPKDCKLKTKRGYEIFSNRVEELAKAYLMARAEFFHREALTISWII
jgi:hypothetical protein